MGYYRRAIIALLVTAVILIFIQWRWLAQPAKWYHYPAKCSQPSHVIDEMITLATKVHKILDAHKIAHILCYGSLWGALRREDVLPWDTDVDFCIWSEDLESVEEAYMYKLFKFEGVALSYDFSKGAYVATYGNARCDLVVFGMSEDYAWLKRLGIRNTFGAQTDQFPSRLIAPPLSTMKLHGKDFPVPRGGIEIQKYLYPDNWQKEVKPPNC